MLQIFLLACQVPFRFVYGIFKHAFILKNYWHIMRFKTNLFYHIWIWSSFEDLLLRPGEGGIHPYFLLELVWFHFAFDP